MFWSAAKIIKIVPNIQYMDLTVYAHGLIIKTDELILTDSHSNSSQLLTFFHYVSHHMQNDAFNYQNLSDVCIFHKYLTWNGCDVC